MFESNPEAANSQEDLAVPLSPEHEEVIAAALKGDEEQAAAEREAAMQRNAHAEVIENADLPAIDVGEDAKILEEKNKNEKIN